MFSNIFNVYYEIGSGIIYTVEIVVGATSGLMSTKDLIKETVVTFTPVIITTVNTVRDVWGIRLTKEKSVVDSEEEASEGAP